MFAPESKATDSSPDKPTRRRFRRRLFWFLMKWGLVGAIWVGFVGLIFTAWCAYGLPDVSRLHEIKRRPSVSLLASDGSLIASYGDLYGNVAGLSSLPAYLAQAVIATEDRRFYSHGGLDPIGLARAIYVNLKAGALVQGGSTITQQLAKNIFLTPERSLHRKGQEVLLALWLERNFTKDEILELYLNRVYFGSGTYGIDAAARKYFAKPAGEVSLFEAAMLAGMLKAPSRYNPLNDKIQARDRARLVLRNMVAAGFLKEEAAAAASIETAPSVTPKGPTQIGQFFADWVLDQVSSYVGFSDADLIVETTLDPRIERAAEANLARVMAEAGPARKASEAALVALAPDGAVKAMVGGLSYRQSQFNRAVQAQRQPGSAFKAFVYLAAFENGYAPDDRFVDAPIRIGTWQPGNYDDKYYGDVDLREAFARSLNSVAVQVSERIGRRKVIETAQRLGITSPLGSDASIALGTSEVSLLELTAAYGVLANEGLGVWPHAIRRITSRDGRVLYERLGSGPGRVASGAAVNAMLDLMAATVDWGTGKGARLDRPAYGKTGTSQNFRDAWFIGLTADLVAGIWVGNDDNSAMDRVTGGSLPVAVWHDFMAEALAGSPIRDVARPASIGWAGTPQPIAPDSAPDQSTEPGGQAPARAEEGSGGLGALIDAILGGVGGGNGGSGQPRSEPEPYYKRENKGGKN